MQQAGSHFIISGGGIAGLSAAYLLGQGGHRICLFEQSSTFAEVGAGLQLSPNATRILERAGLLSEVLKTAVAPERLLIRRARDGAVLSSMALGRQAVQRWHAPFLVTHRADLHNVLLQAVQSLPHVALRTGVRLSDWKDQGDGVICRPAVNEPAIKADGLIGADGLHSLVRKYIDPQAAAVPADRLALRTLVPVAQAPSFARELASQIWIGPKAHLVHYPVRGGTLINIVAIVEYRHQLNQSADFWNQDGGDMVSGLIAEKFGAFADSARSLLAAAPQWRVWPLFDRQPLTHWARGRVCMMGDAAHPMLPFMAQGAVQAIEDAAALQLAAARVGRIAETFALFSRNRHGRAGQIQDHSRRQGQIYHLQGPAALARDLAISLMGRERLRARQDWIYGFDVAASFG